MTCGVNARWSWIGAAAAIALSCGCIESPQAEADYPAVAVSEGNPMVSVGDWMVTLTRADFAFGPVYFCAGQAANCASAIAEITTVTPIDGLASTPTPLGTVHGFTGTIRSASYDFGISWFDTSNQATPASSAPLGHSLHVEGEARRGPDAIPLTVDVDVVPQYQGWAAVPAAPVGAEVTSDAYRLEIHFDVPAWLHQLNNAIKDTKGTMYPTVLDEMAATGQLPFRIKPNTPEHNVILSGIKNVSPPEFQWTH